MKAQSNYALAVLPFCWFVAMSGVSYKLQQSFANASTRYDLEVLKNRSFVNGKSDNLWKSAFPPQVDKEAAFARLWLIKRMEALQHKPPPTLEKALEQWEAAMEYRRKLEGRQLGSVNGRRNETSS